MSDLGSYRSNVNRDVDALVRIAIYSKTSKDCFGEEKTRENTKECMNNIRRAHETSFQKVAGDVIEKAEQDRIKARQEGDWSIDYLNKSRAEEFGIGEGR